MDDVNAKYMKHVLVLGSDGMTGKALRRLWPSGVRVTFAARGDADLCQLEATRSLFQRVKPTHVLNLAAVVGGIQFNIDESVRTLQDNALMAINVLSAAHEADVQNVLSLLSTCIYPTNDAGWFDESMLHDGAPHPTNAGYAYAKRLLFSLSQAYANKFGRNYVCISPPNLYGPHDKFDPWRSHVVGSLIEKFYDAERNEKSKVVKVYGTGAAYRQFLYCDDLAKIILWAMDNYTDVNTALIVADDSEISIRDLVKVIASNFSSDVSIVWDHTKPDGQIHKKGLNVRMRRLLPDFTFEALEAGIAKTVTWYRDTRK